MQLPLTPLEFARRARRLYGDRVATIAPNTHAQQGVTFVSELPKTATGKIQKYVLRGMRAGISAQ